MNGKTNRLKNKQIEQISKRSLWSVLAVLMLIAGLSLLLVRPIGIQISNRQFQKAIEEYDDAVARLDSDELENIRDHAALYNAEYAKNHPFVFSPVSEQAEKEYPEELSIPGTDVMAYIEIPSIDVRLPIYHYAVQDSFSKGCGHLEVSALPISGTDFHAVIMAHRNMPAAVTFEQLDKLQEGSTFRLTILEETMTFRVTEILVTEPQVPQEIYERIKVEEGRELCTLITCTPFGKTTHRLLVCCERME